MTTFNHDFNFLLFGKIHEILAEKWVFVWNNLSMSRMKNGVQALMKNISLVLAYLSPLALSQWITRRRVSCSPGPCRPFSWAWGFFVSFADKFWLNYWIIRKGFRNSGELWIKINEEVRSHDAGMEIINKRHNKA